MNALMHQEWEAWQTVVKDWPGDINDPRFNRVVKAIQLWGEHLASLRVAQPPGVREKAQEAAGSSYEKAKAATP